MKKFQKFIKINETIIDLFNKKYKIPIDDIHIQIPLYELRHGIFYG